MASIHKNHGKNWYCAFYMPDGSRAFRSTGTPDRSEAMQICLGYEKAAMLGKQGRLTEQRAREAIAAIYAMANSDTLPTGTTREYLKTWLAMKSLEVAESSIIEYTHAAERFLEHLGTKADKPIDAMTSKEVTTFRAHLASKVSGATVNKSLKILRGAWTAASKEGLVRENIFAKVDLLKEARSKRRAFTMEELRAILAVCDTEWRGAVMFGLYTGQRLGDVASLTWQNIDLQESALRLVTAKTGRSMPVPLARPLYNFVMKLPSADAPDAPLFPTLASTMVASGTGTLSRQFGEILAGIGLAKKQGHEGTGKGRGARRSTGGLSFHCLRHTATSLLKNAGVSDAVAMEIIGHDSEAISRQYTHIESGTLRAALDKMPDVTMVPAAKS